MATSSLPDRFVLDGSVTLAWLFQDEQDPYADAIIAKLPNLEMLVPRLWHLEVANVLLVGERRKRCSQADTTQWLAYLAGLPIVLDGETEMRAWSDTVNLARQYGLRLMTPVTSSWPCARESRWRRWTPRSRELRKPRACRSTSHRDGPRSLIRETPRHWNIEISDPLPLIFDVDLPPEANDNG